VLRKGESHGSKCHSHTQTISWICACAANGLQPCLQSSLGLITYSLSDSLDSTKQVVIFAFLWLIGLVALVLLVRAGGEEVFQIPITARVPYDVLPLTSPQPIARKKRSGLTAALGFTHGRVT
jgi:hypothetical protein